MSSIHHVWPKPFCKVQWKGEEKSDRNRAWKTLGNGQGWSSHGVHQVPEKKWKKLVVKSSVVPQWHPWLRDTWRRMYSVHLCRLVIFTRMYHYGFLFMSRCIGKFYYDYYCVRRHWQNKTCAASQSFTFPLSRTTALTDLNMCHRDQRSQCGLSMLSRHGVGTCQVKQAHMQLVRDHLATVVSACWATVDCSWPKKWIGVCKLISTCKIKGANGGMNHQIFSPSPNCQKQEKNTAAITVVKLAKGQEYLESSWLQMKIGITNENEDNCTSQKLPPLVKW